MSCHLSSCTAPPRPPRFLVRSAFHPVFAAGSSSAKSLWRLTLRHILSIVRLDVILRSRSIKQKVMRQRVFTFMAAASLVLCTATVVLWLRSASVTDTVHLRFPRHVDSVTCCTIGLGSSGGRIWAEWSDRYYVNMDAEWRWAAEAESALPNASWSTSGLGFATIGDDDWWVDRVVAPHWLLVTAFSALPMFWLAITLRRFERRSVTGRCLTCGYDLRATPERCPECGAVPDAAKAAA